MRYIRYIASLVVITVITGMVPVAFAQEVVPVDREAVTGEVVPAPFPRVRNATLRQTAQRIHLRMMQVNRRRLTGYERILERLRSILERVTAIADRHEAAGIDASAVYDAVSEARRAIDAAQSAIREQASREYLLDGATDVSVRDQLQGMREQLADDLARVGALMREALEAVRTAVRTLRSIQP